MRLVITLVCCASLWFSKLSGASAAAWEEVELGRGESASTALAVDPTSTGHLVVATNRSVYASRDGGKSWQRMFRVSAHATIKAVALANDPHRSILVATDQGLQGSFDGGTTWTRLFHKAGDDESFCAWVLAHPRTPGLVFLGTHRGLFASRDGGRQWTETDLPLQAREIVHGALDPRDAERLYVLTPDRLLVGDVTSGRWEQRFSLIASPDELAEDISALSEDADDETEGTRRRLTTIAIDPENPSTIYLGGSDGVRRSVDAGLTWQSMTGTGLGTQRINRLVVHGKPLQLYAATPRGVARYEPIRNRWEMLTDGLAALEALDLAATTAHVWAATRRGLFRLPILLAMHQDVASPAALAGPLAAFAHEPTIRQVQDAAIRYAEVHPGKIAAWRQQARWRALLPDFSLSGDTNLTDFRHWDSGMSPDALLRGERDIDWGASLSWDLGDLIWSSDQTSIDTRSKLMVELRDDIVDEVTRIYFERRRLQVMLAQDPPADEKTRLEKTLRVQELTALIDGLTGGYFSQQLGTAQ